MNFSPELTTTPAVIMSLMAAFMWGTWFISLKYLKGYPLDGFYLTLFTTSIVFVWSAGFILDGKALIGNIADVYATDPSRIWLTLLFGILYVFGMRISIYVFSIIGLSISQPIQSSVNVIIGTGVAAYIGGVPEGLTITRIVLSLVLLVGAIISSVLAGQWKANSSETNDNQQGGISYSSKDLMKALLLLAFSSLFIPAYTMGLSYGLRSTTHAEGLAVMPFMAVLSSGAFIGCLLTSGFMLTKNKQWNIVLHTPFSIAKFGIMSGIFHYGGNIIHTFATAYLSSAVSWPLGVTSGLWTQVWGLVYGEFRNAPKKSYAALIVGILLYLCGAYCIAMH